MEIEDQLSVRWRERAELLRRIEQGIRRDCRVRAAWLTGSVARGEDDALSDLDIFVVVADDAHSRFRPQPQSARCRPGPGRYY